MDEYMEDQHSWGEFRDFAEDALDEVREFYDDKRREESGQVDAEAGLGSPVVTSADLSSGGTPEIEVNLSNRTVARSQAMNAFNRLRAGDQFTPRPIIDSTRVPRGGVDGTLPQWVIFLGVEAWVPAEDVKEAYRVQQQAVSAERKPPKTQARTYEVAKFVWDVARVHGGRPPWRVLWGRWNYWRDTKSFDTWRDFHRYFKRGQEAMPPRYLASNKQISEAVASGVHLRAFDAWVSSFRE